MSTPIIKYLKFVEFYTTTQIAFVVGCKDSAVSRIVNGRSGIRVEPSFEQMTEEQLERKKTIDHIIELRHLYKVQEHEQVGYYATLLRFLGFTKEELKLTFPNMGTR